MDNLATVILSELRALRDDLASLRGDLNNHTNQTTARLTKLDTQMYSLVGNGKPGRVGVAEEAIDSLKQWRWRMAGITTGISTATTVIAWFLKH